MEQTLKTRFVEVFSPCGQLRVLILLNLVTSIFRSLSHRREARTSYDVPHCDV